MTYLFSKIGKFILISLLLLSVGSLLAQENEPIIIIIDESHSKLYRIDAKTTFLEDKSRNITFEQMLALEKEGKFQKATAKGLNFSFTYSAFWVKFTLQSPKQSRWLMEFGFPLLDYIEVYAQDSSGKWQKQTFGDLLPFTNRPIPYRNVTLPIELPAQTSQTFYVRFQTESASVFPILIQSPQQFEKKVIDEQISYGLQFGVVLVMLFYNLFVFIVVRDKNYLFYVIAIFGNLSIIASVSGHIFQYIFPSLPLFANQYLLIGLNLSTAGNNFFALNFLQTKRYGWIFFYVQGFLTILGGLLLFTPFFMSYLVVARWSVFLAFITTYVTLAASIWSWAKGNRSAVFFTLAWVSYLVGIQIVGFKAYGWLPVNFFTTHAAEIGNALEVTLLSFAVGDRYRILRIEKEKAQAEALQAQKELNESLEEKVKARTQELSEALDELNQTNEELKITLEQTETQQQIIAKKNQNITDSIQYAQRIQHAILASPQQFSSIFKDSFVFFKPKDIVSGDFFFLHQEYDEKRGELTFLAAVDCTGHGVPGALMSMLGNEVLHEIITQSHIYSPEIILEEMHIRIRKALKQNENDVRDGMDMALIVIDKNAQILEFAGARNPLVYVQNGEIKQIKGDKISVGGERQSNKIDFTKHTLSLVGEERITFAYLFSDGYTDQFGGIEKRKFSIFRLREMFQEMHSLPATQQFEILDQRLNKWINEGREQQIDDILVIGVQL